MTCVKKTHQKRRCWEEKKLGCCVCSGTKVKTSSDDAGCLLEIRCLRDWSPGQVCRGGRQGRSSDGFVALQLKHWRIRKPSQQLYLRFSDPINSVRHEARSITSANKDVVEILVRYKIITLNVYKLNN